MDGGRDRGDDRTLTQGWRGRRIGPMPRVRRPPGCVCALAVQDTVTAAGDGRTLRQDVQRCVVTRSEILGGRYHVETPWMGTPADLRRLVSRLAARHGTVLMTVDDGLLGALALGVASGAWPPGDDWDLGVAITTDPPWAMSWRHARGRVILVSCETILPGFEPPRGGPWTRARAMFDALTWWIWYIGDRALGRVQWTAGAQALETWRATALGDPVWAGGSREHVETARDAFSAGRVAALRVGDLGDGWTDVDMTACYRSVMRDCWLPCRSASRLREPSLDVLERAIERDCAIAVVDVDDRGGWYPRRDGATVRYDAGRGVRVLTTPDLQTALERREIKQVQFLATWSRGRPLREWAQAMQRRMDAISDLDPPWARGQLKVLTNAIYGRFGMRRREWIDIGTAETPGIEMDAIWDIDAQAWIRTRTIGRALQVERDLGPHPMASVALAAHVAAHARGRLRRLVEAAGEAHVAHMDTDGLLVDAVGFERLQGSRWWRELGCRVTARGPARVEDARAYSCGARHIVHGTPRDRVVASDDGGRTHYVRVRVPGTPGDPLAGGAAVVDGRREIRWAWTRPGRL